MTSITISSNGTLYPYGLTLDGIHGDLVSALSCLFGGDLKTRRRVHVYLDVDLLDEPDTAPTSDVQP